MGVLEDAVDNARGRIDRAKVRHADQLCALQERLNFAVSELDRVRTIRDDLEAPEREGRR